MPNPKDAKLLGSILFIYYFSEVEQLESRLNQYDDLLEHIRYRAFVQKRRLRNL